MNCDQITKTITDIQGLYKTLDLAIKKEIPAQDGLGAKKSIETFSGEVNEAKMSLAEKLFGQDFLGPEQIKEAFLGQVEMPETIPPVPFSKDELERAKELGQMLVLRLPLTMAEINEKLDGKLDDGAKVLHHDDEKTGKLKDDAWYKDEKFLTDERIELKWALVSKEKVPRTTIRNYLEQTDKMVDYLKDQVFKARPMPQIYQHAIEEFKKQRSDIEKAMSSDWKKAAEMLISLQVTELTRQTPAEVFYDLVVFYQINNKRLFYDFSSWTKRCVSNGGLVSVGNFNSSGINVYSHRPDSEPGLTGTSFSRSI